VKRSRGLWADDLACLDFDLLRYAYRRITMPISKNLAWRIGASFVATATGWISIVLAYVIFFAPSSNDVRWWRNMTGLYAMIAYCVIGLPVAMGAERLAPRVSPRRAVLYGGLLGATLAALPPSLFLYPMTGPAGFLGGAISMAVYMELLKVGAV